MLWPGLSTPATGTGNVRDAVSGKSGCRIFFCGRTRKPNGESGKQFSRFESFPGTSSRISGTEIANGKTITRKGQPK